MSAPTYICLPRLRKEVEKHLIAYRRTKKKGAYGSNQWVNAIDAAREYFRQFYPAKERYMSLRFGLDAPIPSHRDLEQLSSRIALALNISQSTAYKWREDVIEIVLYAAMERQIISLRGGNPSGKSSSS